MPRSRGGPCDAWLTAVKPLSALRFLCRVLAAVPATWRARLVKTSVRGVSMPRSRGGPCDGAEPTFPGLVPGAVSMPRSRGGPCDNASGSARRHDVARFYAAFSRRSLRQADVPQREPSNVVFLCRVLAAVPATLPRTKVGNSSGDLFLCRVLAAVPATREASPASPWLFLSFYAAFSRRSLRPLRVSERPYSHFSVSMPRSRGGPCDCPF